MTINRGIVLIEQKSKFGKRTFQIKETINTIEYHITTHLSEDQVNDLIDFGFEVRIISEWLP